MFTKIKFENFRGFKQLELNELAPITLISGKNNSGKSSILEGLFLFIDHTSLESFPKINSFRAMPVAPNSTKLWESFFYMQNVESAIGIEAEYNNKNATLTYTKDESFIPVGTNMHPEIINQFVSAAKSDYTLRFDFHNDDYLEEGHFSISNAGQMINIKTNRENNFVEPMPHTQFINNFLEAHDNTIVEWFGKLELQGEKQQVVDALKIIEPSLTDIITLSIDGFTQLYGKVNGSLLPLKLAGDGINRLLYQVLAIMSCKDSIILIDEIESGFHYSTFNNLWEVITQTAIKNNCQIVATTHSFECISAALETVEKNNLSDKFCYYRLEKEKGICKANYFPVEILRYAIDSKMEVR